MHRQWKSDTPEFMDISVMEEIQEKLWKKIIEILSFLV